MLGSFVGRHRDNLIVTASFAASLLIGAGLFALLGANPLEAYAGMFSGAFGSGYATFSTLSRAMPILLSAMSISVAFSAGMWNIGAEGQLYIGAFTAAFVGFSLPALPAFPAVAAVLAAGVLIGALWAYVPGRLSLGLGMNVVVLTIMLNSVSALFVQYLATGPYNAPGANTGSTPMIAEAARFAKFSALSNLNWSAPIAVAAAAVVAAAMLWSVWGYECRMIRLNRRFALYGGVDADSRQIVAMTISGALAGLAGTLLVMGDHYRFIIGISPGYTWTAMILAMMVNYNPIGVTIASVVYAAMSSGALEMELLTGVPGEVVEIMTHFAVFFVAAGISIANRRANRLRED